jgi:hypothetical protein
MRQDIIIDASKETLSCRITSRSMHVIGIHIEVINSDENSILEEYKSSTEDSVTIDLTSLPSFYKGKFIKGTFVIASPNGDDENNYEVEFTLLEDNEPLAPAIVLTGKTVNGLETRIAIFNAI